jgi:hypothetical protein
VEAFKRSNAMSTEKMGSEQRDAQKMDTETMYRQPANVEKLNEVLGELRKPFHPSHITWKPGAVAKSGDKALALAYGDLRAYQNRLDEVCGANWSVSYTPWTGPGSGADGVPRIICHLTIFGVTRSSTGEADGDSERNEIAGTVAEAQAFKRACAMFGLGRYLYTLPSVWAEYDKERRQFTEPAKAKLLSIILQHYRRHMNPQTEGRPAGPDLFQDEEPTDAAAPRPAERKSGRANGNAKHANGENGAEENDGELEPLRRQFDELGRHLYGAQWDQVCRRNVQRVSGGSAKTTGELSSEQIQKLIDGMKKLMRQREAV